MNISSAQYAKNLQNTVNHIKATINGEVTFVPLNPDNTDYAAIFFFKQKTAYEIQAAE